MPLMDDLSHLPTIRAAQCDFNGRWRGKRMPGAMAAKIESGGLRLPLAMPTVDITGADIEGSPLIFEAGDGDGIALPTDRGPVPMPWLPGDTALVPVTIHNDDGTPFPVDPRHALARVLDRFAARGWQVIAAVELEFYLVRRDGDGIAPALRPDGSEIDGVEILSLDDLDAFDGFFSDVYDASAQMGIDAQTAISEAGPGQFEVTLNHGPAMRAADDGLLFKTLIKGLARKHGMCATFMAKPYTDHSGSGAHLHFSVLDESGTNIFDNGGPDGSDALASAVAGCLEGMRQMSLLFTPHPTSFDRLVDGAHAPTGLCWGYENRTVALRIPGGAAAARRVEHRVSGADICPYLMMAGILGPALVGIETGLRPPPPTAGNAYEADVDRMATDFETAIEAFATSNLARDIFDPMFIQSYTGTKRQEARIFAEMATNERLATYLERV